MFLIKVCRFCNKHIITRNDKTTKDNMAKKRYERARMLCDCK